MRQLHGTSLWIGNAGDLRKSASIFDNGIEAVIDIAEEEPVSSLPRSLMYIRLPLADDASNTTWKVELAIETAANLLQREVSTLIACSAGLSRSLCVAAGAIARIRRMAPPRGAGRGDCIGTGGHFAGTLGSGCRHRESTSR